MLSCTLSQQCVLFILLCLKEFSQFVPDEKHREKERIEGGQTDRKRERVRLGVFLTSLHFSLTPRSFSKAFSKKKKKQRLCDGSNSSSSHFPAYQADYRLWYFSPHQSLCCVCFIHCWVDEPFHLNQCLPSPQPSPSISSLIHRPRLLSYNLSQASLS